MAHAAELKQSAIQCQHISSPLFSYMVSWENLFSYIEHNITGKKGSENHFLNQN